MTDNNPLITFIQSGRIGDFKVEPGNEIFIAGAALYESSKVEKREATLKIDEGKLIISNKSLNFSGSSKTIYLPLSNIVRVQPYANAIDIYPKGQKKPYKFGWGANVNMKLVGLPDDDGKIKPLSGRIVCQFIINERNRIGNLIKSK